MNRIVKYGIYQLVIIPIAALCQFQFIISVTNDFNGTNLQNILYVLNLSTLIIFLDYGYAYEAFKDASIQVDSNDEIKINLIRRYRAIGFKLLFLNAILGILMLILNVNPLISFYVMAISLTIPGFILLNLLRGFGKHLIFLILFNMSWPLSLMLYFVIQKYLLHLSHITSAIGYVPLLASALINLVVSMMGMKLFAVNVSNQTNSGLSIEIRKFSPLPLLLMTSGSFAIQSDKLIIAEIGTGEDIASYLLCGLLATSGLSVINSLGSISWGQNLNRFAIRKDFHHREFVFFGIVMAACYALTIHLLTNFAIISISIDTVLILGFSVLIMMNSLIFTLQSKLIVFKKEITRICGNFGQMLTTIILSLLFRNSLSGINMLKIILLSTLFHLVFLFLYNLKLKN